MPFRFIEEDEEVTPPFSEDVEEESQEDKQKFRFVEEKPSKVRSLLSAAPKGFIKEFATQLGKNPLVNALNKIPTIHPSLETDILDVIENILPTEDSFAEKSLERGGKIAPYAFLGGGNIAGQALRSAIAGFLGQGAEEIGLPTWAQALIELPAFGFPGLGKTIQGKKGQESLLEGARKLGMTEEEIAPLIQSEKKIKNLSKFAPRRGRTKKVLDRSYQSLKNVYDRLEKAPIANKEISPQASEKVIKSIDDTLSKFPSELRKKIQEDYQDLVSKPITGSSLTNFFKDINYYVGKGNTQLGVLKEPVITALEDISPQLANDYRLTNKLYSQYHKIAEKLKPNLVSDLFSAGEAVRTLLGISTGNYPLLIESVGEMGGRLLAREMLLNPRLQNLSSKMVTALNNNKIAIANDVLQDYIKEIEESIPEVANKLKEIDLFNLSNQEKDKRQKP